MLSFKPTFSLSSFTFRDTVYLDRSETGIYTEGKGVGELFVEEELNKEAVKPFT